MGGAPKYTPESENLRQRAEERLAESRTDIATMPTADVGSLVYELQVHQVELEMQNEELQRTAIVDITDRKLAEEALADHCAHVEELVDRRTDELRQNITDLKRVEKELRESEKRFRSVVEDTPLLICQFLPGGEITYVNDAYCRYFKRLPEELIGSSFLSLIPEADRETVMAGISALTIESPTQSHEHQVFGPEGETRWQHWTNRALFDPQGKAVTYQSIGEDITDRKRAEEEREHARAFMQTVINGSPDAIMVINRNHSIALANRTVCETAGVKDPVAAGLKCYQVSHGAATPCKDTEHPCPLEQVVATKIPVIVEHIHRDAEGKTVLTEVVAAPIFDEEGEVVQIIESCRDITDRKQVEEKATQDPGVP